VNRWLAILLLLLFTLFVNGDKTMPLSIQEVKKKHEAKLMALPGVVSVGIGRDKDGNPAVVVGLDGSRAEIKGKIPAQLDGHPLIIQVIGPVRAQ
jgi:hypothetical protein